MKTRGLQGALGEFPECLEEIMLGGGWGKLGLQKRRSAIIRVIMRRLLTALKRIHSLGLVHRDVRYLLHFTLQPLHTA